MKELSIQSNRVLYNNGCPTATLTSVRQPLCTWKRHAGCPLRKSYKFDERFCRTSLVNSKPFIISRLLAFVIDRVLCLQVLASLLKVVPTQRRESLCQRTLSFCVGQVLRINKTHQCSNRSPLLTSFPLFFDTTCHGLFSSTTTSISGDLLKHFIPFLKNICCSVAVFVKTRKEHTPLKY